MTIFFGVVTMVLVAVLAFLLNRHIGLRRDAYIRSFELPRRLFEQLRKRRPELALKDCQLVAHGLRQFFMAYRKSGRRYVSMPSQVADDLWHEFILHTRNYRAFCNSAFGGFLHHTPAAVLGSSKRSNAGLRRVWWYACLEDNINPRKPTRLPLLFALDTKFAIPDGFRYAADCESFRKRPANSGSEGIVHCGGDFGSSSIDGSTDGFGDSSGSSGDGGDGGSGGGDGGGCGGGGCSS